MTPAAPLSVTAPFASSTASFATELPTAPRPPVKLEASETGLPRVKSWRRHFVLKTKGGGILYSGTEIISLHLEPARGEIERGRQPRFVLGAVARCDGPERDGYDSNCRADSSVGRLARGCGRLCTRSDHAGAAQRGETCGPAGYAPAPGVRGDRAGGASAGDEGVPECHAGARGESRSALVCVRPPRWPSVA